MKESTEEKLKAAAGLYAKKEGESLMAEVDEIQRQGVSYLTPRADRTVRELAAKGLRPRSRKLTVGLAAAAACAVFAVRMITGIVGPEGDVPASFDSSSSAGSAAPSESAEPPESAAPPDPAEPPGPAESPGPAAPDPFAPAGILPISFSLPADYRVKDSDFDNGVSIYRLESSRSGDVVLTMYYENDAPVGGLGQEAGFDEIVIDGTPVPAKVNGAYKLLAFEAGGRSYTLSSKDDLGALAAFYRNITESVPA